MATVLRLTRHPLDADRTQFLKMVFGDDIKILDRDLPYGDDAVAAVQGAITEAGDVVAVEAIAPFPVLMKLVDCQRHIGVPIIRAAFKRDANGRAVVSGVDERGRDILAFSHYEKLIRLSIEVEPLTPDN